MLAGSANGFSAVFYSLTLPKRDLMVEAIELINDKVLHRLRTIVFATLWLGSPDKVLRLTLRY